MLFNKNLKALVEFFFLLLNTFLSFLSSIPSFLLLLFFYFFIDFLFQLEPGNLYSEYRMKFSLLGLQIYSTEYQSALSTRVHEVPEFTECFEYQWIVLDPSTHRVSNHIQKMDIRESQARAMEL